MPLRPLILASTSPYRRELLARLGLPFEVEAPGVDEVSLPDEAPEALALRLARLKAAAVAARHPAAWVIGSDQVAVLDGRALGKPGTHAAAVAQLEAASGQPMQFHTAVCLHDAASGESAAELVTVRVRFRELDVGQIERYLQREQPYDCAGSARVEGLGISLLETVESDDPTALIGLPLIRLVTLLRHAGVRVP
jgi:septum formation protein